MLNNNTYLIVLEMKIFMFGHSLKTGLIYFCLVF